MPFLRTTLLATLLVLASRAARADELGLDFGGGPVLARHGPLGTTFAPDLDAWFGVVGYSGVWEADARMLALSKIGSRDGIGERDAVGGSIGLRRHVRLAGGVKKVRNERGGHDECHWQLTAFGAAGLAVLALHPPDTVGTTSARTLSSASVIAAPDTMTLAGPQFGAGLDLSFGDGHKVGHLVLNVTDQEIVNNPTGGYAIVEVSLVSAVTTLTHLFR